MTPFLHTKQQLQVVHFAVMIWISEHLALLPQSSGLFAVNVSLHAGLSSADEHAVPQGESSQSHCHRAGQHPEEDDALMSSGFSEGVLWRRGLVVSLYSIVGIQKQVPAADAAVDAAQSHVEAEGVEVAMVEMADTVVQPGTVMVHLQNTHVADAAVVRPRRFWCDTFLTDGHGRDVNFVLWWVSW